MLVKIKCDLPEVFQIPQVITDKGNILKFTKGLLETKLNEENVKILKEFTNSYGKYIEVFVDEEAQNLNEDKIINNINKETLLNEKKARLYAELDEYREKTKADIKEKFSEYIDNLDAKKEEMISQIEKNIERIEE